MSKNFEDTQTDKWLWKMDWCKAQRLHPGDKDVWGLAEAAWEANIEWYRATAEAIAGHMAGEIQRSNSGGGRG